MAPVPCGRGATVAVTGATGFLGSHICAALLSEGYRVRAVVRDPADEAKAAHLFAFPGAKERLELRRGVLDEPNSYDDAFAGADAVIHSAAVVEINDVKDPENEIVRPSVDGVQNVLNSADKSGTVRRFVHTSSEIAALKWDEPPDATFSEASWNTTSTVANGDPYGFAKARAERLVLDHKGAGFDCVTILPGVNLGPCLTKAHTKSSAVVVRQFLYGNEQPEYHAHLVDVRDTATAHVRALSVDLKEGDCQRFLVCSDEAMQVSLLEQPLSRLFPEYRITANPFPAPWLKFFMRLPLVGRLAATEFRLRFADQRFSLDNTKSKSQLGLTYRPLDETLRDTVKSMVDAGFIKPRLKSK